MTIKELREQEKLSQEEFAKRIIKARKSSAEISADC